MIAKMIFLYTYAYLPSVTPASEATTRTAATRATLSQREEKEDMPA